MTKKQRISAKNFAKHEVFQKLLIFSQRNGIMQNDMKFPEWCRVTEILPFGNRHRRLLCRLFIQNLRLSLEKSGGICYNIIDSTSCSFSLEKRRLSGGILDFSVGNCHRQFRYGGAVPCCTADFFVPSRRENDVRTGRDQEPLSAVSTAKKGCSVIKVCFRERVHCIGTGIRLWNRRKTADKQPELTDCSRGQDSLFTGHKSVSAVQQKQTQSPSSKFQNRRDEHGVSH